MRKLYLALILLIIAILALPFIYVLVPTMRPTLEDIFGGLFISASASFAAFSAWFMTLPYWPVIAMGIAFLVGILLDRKAHAIYYGIRRRMVGGAYADAGLGYQTAPSVQTPVVTQTTPQQPQVAAPQPLPQKPEADAT